MKDESIPECIGPYRMTGRLGRGGMGEVLRGYDDRLGRPVALKRILPGGSDPDLARQRFRREARMAANLSDSAIVQVYDWVEAEDRDWLVMELVDGTPLDELMAEGPLGVESSLRVAREVASGLAAAHEAGLIHRDLKPANVMLVEGEGSAPDRAKILDFGIAKPIDFESGVPISTLTEAGHIVGTVTAMSPEQALGQPVNHRSDLFALGSLLYEMLSGVSPFAGDNDVATLSRICTLKQTALHRRDPEISTALSDFVDRLLAKTPEQRPGDTRQVVAELDRLLTPTDQPASQPPSTLANQTTLIAEAHRESSESAEIESTGPVTRPKVPWRPRGWLTAALAVLLLSSWGLSSWLKPPGKEDAEIGPVSATGVAVTEPVLDSHELYRRGMALLERYDRKGNIDAAILDFQRALAIDENYAPALAGLGRAYWRDFYFGSLDPQRLDQARAAARRAVEIEEHLAVAHVSLGLVLAQAGQTDEALEALEQALLIEPDNGDAHYGLSLLYQMQGDRQRAVEHILQAIETQPDNWSFYAWLGSLHHRSSRHQEAELAFRRSLQLAPGNFLSFRNLGVSLYMQGDVAGAATQFQNALEIQPDPSLYANLGTIYFAQGLYPQSVSALEKAIEAGGSNNYMVWGNLGDAYRWTPDNEPRAERAFQRAIQLLSKKLEAAPQSLTLRTQQMLYLAKLGDCDQFSEEESILADEIDKEASQWYRLAAANEICDHRDVALARLKEALQAGYPITEIQADPELLELRRDARYHQLAMNSGG